MKILIVNYRFFISGGPERYLFNVMDLLEKKGHTVIPFSIQHQHNRPSEYESYFLSPVGTGKEVYYKEYNKRNIRTISKTAGRMFYSFEAKRKLEKLIAAEKPDLVYILHFQNKLSASVFDAPGKLGVPVVHRVSDFGMICANGLFYRPGQKDTCERCLQGSRFNAVKHKCVQGSRVLSFVKFAALQLQAFLKLDKKIAAYVVPSGFTISRLAQYGIPAAKMRHIPTFFNFGLVPENTAVEYTPVAVYIGRVEEEKGLRTLVNAFADTGWALKIIGSSSAGFEKELLQLLEGKPHRIEFLGQLAFSEIAGHLATCAFTIMPTEVYDNFPNTVLESYAFRKAVVASRIGSLTGIVDHGQTGMLYEVKNPVALAAAAGELIGDMELCRRLGNNAYEKLQREYSAEAHYTKLMDCFSSVIRENSNALVTEQIKSA